MHSANLMIASTLACVLVTNLVCAAAGSAIGSRTRLPAADMLVGFGLLGGLLAIVAVTTRLPLSWIMAGLAIGSGFALLVRLQFPGGRTTWIAVALLSPILVKAAAHQPAAWDDFWNWLP